MAPSMLPVSLQAWIAGFGRWPPPFLEWSLCWTDLVRHCKAKERKRKGQKNGPFGILLAISSLFSSGESQQALWPPTISVVLQSGHSDHWSHELCSWLAAVTCLRTHFFCLLFTCSLHWLILFHFVLFSLLCELKIAKTPWAPCKHRGRVVHRVQQDPVNRSHEEFSQSLHLRHRSHRTARLLIPFGLIDFSKFKIFSPSSCCIQRLPAIHSALARLPGSASRSMAFRGTKSVAVNPFESGWDLHCPIPSVFVWFRAKAMFIILHDRSPRNPSVPWLPCILSFQASFHFVIILILQICLNSTDSIHFPSPLSCNIRILPKEIFSLYFIEAIIRLCPSQMFNSAPVEVHVEAATILGLPK